MSSNNYKDLETEVLATKIRLDIAMTKLANEPDNQILLGIKNDLLNQYETLLKLQLEKSRNNNERFKTIAAVLTPLIGLSVAWLAREGMQSAFWKDITREVTSWKIK